MGDVDVAAAFEEADEDYGDDFEVDNSGKKEESFSLARAAKLVGDF